MLIGAEPLDLRLTLIDSAQCFRWVEREGRFGCALGDGYVWLRGTPRGIEAEGDFDALRLRRYLDLDRDYAAIAAEFDGLPEARRAMARFPGLRVLNQPAWETLIGFILSANNNVTRIRGLNAALCRRYGQVRETPFGPLYGFPGPEALASADEAELRAMKMGYRAPFLVETARRVREGFPLEALGHMPYDEAHAALTTLPGVGDKVADCVLLFGCGHACAFPVDVWVDRLARCWLGIERGSRRETARAARERLGPHAGIIQQYLFHAARVGAIALDRTDSRA